MLYGQEVEGLHFMRIYLITGYAGGTRTEHSKRTKSMKTVGIIGGIGPESTVEYYRLIIELYRQQESSRAYPHIMVNSIDMKRMLDLVGENNLTELTAYLLVEVRRLANAGADFGLLASNTPHVVFDALVQQSPIPLISIVEVTCQAAEKQGLKRVGLFGTRFTMQGRFYSDTLGKAGITTVLPAPDEQTYIHGKYMGELVNGIFLPDTREGLLSIVRRLMLEERIDGLILGGTELPLIMRNTEDSRR
jgi:aspartate racemase